MLVFSNGAVKSGSTWLFQIAWELTGFGPPPARYANPKWQSQPVYSVDQDNLDAFLGDAEVRAMDVLAKNHFGARHARQRLLADPLVRVLNIRRDVRDVLVSAYFHGNKGRARAANFAEYYWQAGRWLAQRVLDYQIIWDVRSPRYLCITYESLLTNFAGETSKVGLFLGRAPSVQEIERIRQATSPAVLNERFGFSDFNRVRHGQSGDWQAHFDNAITGDLAQIIQRSRSPLYRLALDGPTFVRRLFRRWHDIEPEHLTR
jgi:hypothetical protein